MGARLQKFWGAWARYKIDPWVVQVLRDGYRIPFLNNRLPPLTSTPREYTSYLGSPEKYAVLQQEVEDMLRKEAIEIVCPGEPAFYNRLFLVPKPSGKWRPVLDVSRLNKFVHNTKFSMETAQTVQDSVREGDWLISLDMMDAYFHIPIHPQSRKFLRFVFNGKVFQFKALCFGLSTDPQVFTRVLAPLSKIVHLAGFRIVLYLDDWLVLAKTREEVLRARKFLLELAQELGIIINREKSHLDPSQSLVYLGIQIDTIRFWVSPAKKRIDKALCLFREFWSSGQMPARSWLSLLGHMSSLEKFVPGARLRMRRYQYYLKRVWRRDYQPKDVLVPVPPKLKEGLVWWLDRERLERGLSLVPKQPDLFLFTDASRKSWGATLDQTHLSGRWNEKEYKEHINKLELRAIFYALKELEKVVTGKVIAVFADNTTALSYVRKQGGTKSWDLFHLVEEMFLWLEEHDITLLPRFVQGKTNVVADTLSREGQIIPTEWTLNAQVCEKLWRLWGRPQVDLFATSLTKRLPVYCSPHLDPNALGVDAFLQSWENLDGYAFPPFAIIRQVINKLRLSKNCRITLVAPWWPQREWFPDLLSLLVEVPRALPLRKDLLQQPASRALHLGLHTLHLTGWRLSSVLEEQNRFQERSQKEFLTLGPSPLTHCTN